MEEFQWDWLRLLDERSVTSKVEAEQRAEQRRGWVVLLDWVSWDPCRCLTCLSLLPTSAASSGPLKFIHSCAR